MFYPFYINKMNHIFKRWTKTIGLIYFFLLISLHSTQSIQQILDMDPENIATLSKMFSGVDTVQLYHLLSDSTFYEQGSVDKELMYYKTAIGFWATASNEKAVFVFAPTDNRLSFLPDIAISASEGFKITWRNSAQVYFDTTIDSSVWDGITFMGTMGGSTFKVVVDYVVQYALATTYYQPFSVYQQYPGSRFISASSCDESVWFLFEQLATLQISLNPVIVPKKVKIILYSPCVPEIYSMNVTQHKTEVISYFQQLKRCLHIRSTQHVVTLSEFTGVYSGCLSRYAYLYKDADSLYKVNLTIPYAENLNPTEGVPQPLGWEGGYTWVDLAIVAIFLGAFVVGIFLLLRKSLVFDYSACGSGTANDNIKHTKFRDQIL